MESTTTKNRKLLVIASYPPKGEKHSRAIVGGAMYAKNTLQAVMAAAKKKQTKPHITVLAEAFHGKKETYTEDSIQVKRFWKRSSITAYTSLLQEIFSQHKDTKTVVIEFEFAMFGDRLSLLPLPLFLLILKLMGKRTIFVFHQVVDHIGDMGGHLNIKESGIKTTLLNKILQFLYTSLLLLSDEVIVFEEVLRKRLARLGDSSKIRVIPFGTETFPHPPSPIDARRKLKLPENSFIVFVFGFIAWYKGSDWLVDTVAKDQGLKTNDITVILGGGGNPNHMNKPYYVSYIERVKEEAQKAGITVTGFIPEEDLPLYFQAADLILLPYRTMMSSSGPLSLAFSFHKPLLLSEALAPVFATEDMAEALKEAGLTEDDVSFPLNDTFPSLLTAVATDTALQKKLTNLSRIIAHKRTWETIGDMYYDAFFPAKTV